MLLTVAIMAVGIYVSFSPLAAYLGFVALPKIYFFWLIATLLSYCTLTQLISLVHQEISPLVVMARDTR